MAQQRIKQGPFTAFTIVLPGVRLSAQQRKAALRDFQKILNGQGVPGKRDSVCVGVNLGPVSVSYCKDR